MESSPDSRFAISPSLRLWFSPTAVSPGSFWLALAHSCLLLCLPDRGCCLPSPCRPLPACFSLSPSIADAPNPRARLFTHVDSEPPGCLVPHVN
ncbi:hypothetical protein BO71DRAFT_99776 [Aspergillus ellipticus CBS 707.79]|uniref:Uncharacterized protein n=1 Tax=Aspergillus ellipticus CBS 707.79 TaxID=1448320 RepID=A0A319D5J1_9EURO|nr:hypothetical protein BO71DRAFT_99776 [Aspergillus ellipticus CBS 707.79]